MWEYILDLYDGLGGRTVGMLTASSVKASIASKASMTFDTVMCSLLSHSLSREWSLPLLN